MAFDSKDSNIKIVRKKNTNTAQSTPNELGLRTQNVVFYFKEKYTHKPFESKCFLSLFNTIEANGYQHNSYPVFFFVCAHNT